MKTQNLTITADWSLEAGSENALPRKFSGVAYSGGLVPGHGIVIDLSTVRHEKRMPLMIQHDHSSIIGSINEVTNTGAELTVAGELFSDFDKAATDVAMKAQRGIQYQMSVGVFNANDEFIAAGKVVTVNGRNFSGPVSVLRDAFIRETSIVALGADHNTRAQIFSQPQGAVTMTIEQLQEKVAQLSATVATLTSERDTLKTENAELRERESTGKREARLSAVKQLFADTGREFSEDASKPYIELSDVAFGAISKDMRDNTRKLDPKLFSEQANGGSAGGLGDKKGATLLSAESIFEKRKREAAALRNGK